MRSSRPPRSVAEVAGADMTIERLRAVLAAEPLFDPETRRLRA
jgi:hypothetical protein